MKKLTLLAASLALAFGTAAQASITVKINPDGPGGDATQTVAGLDWNAGNSISVAEAGQSIAAGSATAGQSFMTYAHGALSAFNNSLGTAIGGLGLNTNYEWTYVAGFKETFSIVTDASGVGLSVFTIDTTHTGNFFEIYYDPAQDASNLTGTGFNNGTLILTAAYLPSNPGSFVVTSPNVVALDQFGTDQYAGYNTLQGGGSTPLALEVTWFDPAFFVSAPSIIDFTLQTTAEQKLPYQQQNPSSCFWDGSAYIDGAGNGIAGGCGVAGDGGTIGLVNGLTGPNVMFQTDGTASFDGEIPEPGSLALLGLGMTALGFVAMRRRKAK